MVGDTPRIGTDYNHMAMDVEYIQKNKSDIISIIDSLISN